MSTELITLEIVTKGEVISSNFPAFAEMVRARLGEINRDLKTDEDFDQAEADVKAIKAAEKALLSAREKALQDAEQLYDLLSQMDNTKGELTETRLELEKQIDRQKKQVRADLLAEFADQLKCAKRLRGNFKDSLESAIKGKRTIVSMRSALVMQVAIHNRMLDANEKAIEAFIAEHGETMVPDRDDLQVKSQDAVEAELRRRVEAAKAAAERKRLQEEAERLKAEADAKARADAEAKAREEIEAANAKAKAEIEAANKRFAESGETIRAEALHTATPDGGYKETTVERPVRVGPIDNTPAEPDPQDEAQEWDEFKQSFLEAFQPIRVARTILRYQGNKDKADRLAAAINEAWKGVA